MLSCIMKKWISAIFRVFSPKIHRNDEVFSRISASSRRAVEANPEASREMQKKVRDIVRTYKDDLAELAKN
jgi:hypothetical protein